MAESRLRIELDAGPAFALNARNALRRAAEDLDGGSRECLLRLEQALLEAERVSVSAGQPAWEVLATVRVGPGFGYDVVRDSGRVFTRRFIPGGVCGGALNEAEAHQLLADLYGLARYEPHEVGG